MLTYASLSVNELLNNKSKKIKRIISHKESSYYQTKTRQPKETNNRKETIQSVSSDLSFIDVVGERIYTIGVKVSHPNNYEANIVAER